MLNVGLREETRFLVADRGSVPPISAALGGMCRENHVFRESYMSSSQSGKNLQRERTAPTKIFRALALVWEQGAETVLFERPEYPFLYTI